MIEIKNLQKSFNHREVLNGVSLKIEKGEIIAVIGSSGVGKSVLLKHVSGLIRPDSGATALVRCGDGKQQKKCWGLLALRRSSGMFSTMTR